MKKIIITVMLAFLMISSIEAQTEQLQMNAIDKQKQDKAAEYGQLKYGIPSVYFPKKMILEDSMHRVEQIHD